MLYDMIFPAEVTPDSRPLFLCPVNQLHAQRKHFSCLKAVKTQQYLQKAEVSSSPDYPLRYSF